MTSVGAARWPGVALLGLAGLLLAVGVASIWSGASRHAGREDTAAAATAAAAAFVRAYGTYDAPVRAEYVESLAVLAGGPLRAAIGAAVLDEEALRHHRHAETQVESSTVTALSADTATVAVTALQRRRWSDPSLGQTQHEQVRQVVICRLVRVDGQWLVVELRLQSEEAVDARRR